jgi:hypothetical protein
MDGGKMLTTRDGSGKIYAVDLAVYEVAAFDPATGLPAGTRLVTNQTVRADDPAALKRQKWEFAREQGKFDWELKALPAKTHETLFRLFLHADPQLWQTLLVHTEADLEPMPPELAAVSKNCFKDFLTHVIVCELLNDPSLKLTSTYIERDDPPSTWWIEQQKVKAPWSLNRARLEPACGSLVFGADGTLQCEPLSPAAEKQMAGPEKSKAKVPKLGEESDEAGESGAQ